MNNKLCIIGRKDLEDELSSKKYINSEKSEFVDVTHVNEPESNTRVLKRKMLNF